jgi:hypothetical protein
MVVLMGPCPPLAQRHLPLWCDSGGKWASDANVGFGSIRVQPNPLLLSRDHYSDFKRRGPIREQNIPMPSLGAYAEDDDAPPPTAAAAAAMAVSAGMRADEPDDDDVTGEQETPPTMPAEEDAASSESKRLQVRELTVFEKCVPTSLESRAGKHKPARIRRTRPKILFWILP